MGEVSDSMEYAFAALLLAESGAEIDEQNLVAVLEAAGTGASESRVKAVVAALEGVDVDGILDGGLADADRAVIGELDEGS